VIATSPIYNLPEIKILYNYDQKPRVIQKMNEGNWVDSIKFTYDGNGQRVKKENLDAFKTTYYFSELYEWRDDVEVFHLFAGNRRVLSIRDDGQNQFHQFHHPNHLGSASFITDSNGNPKQQIEYYPFGTYRDKGSPTGTYDYDLNFPNVNYTFTGQEDDDDTDEEGDGTDLYNYGARLYDPIIGRFISPDRIVQAPENPQSLNRYSYCQNNPLIYTDPSGEIFGIDDLFLVLLVSNIAYGALSAKKAGMSPLEGAFIAAVTSFISFGVGYGVGGAVTSTLASMTTISATAAQSIGTYVGTYAGGATAGAINAGVYGGNPLKGALYGGLTAVAMLATFQGVVALVNGINGSQSTNQQLQKAAKQAGIDNPGESVNNPDIEAAKTEAIRAAKEAFSIPDVVEQYAEKMTNATVYRTPTNYMPDGTPGECGWAPIGGKNIYITPDGFLGPEARCLCLPKLIAHEGVHLIGGRHGVHEAMFKTIEKAARCAP
jgi:RHS repeat-associated protein